jgi:Opioid growth factor receptor (OGFr) conserved region
MTAPGRRIVAFYEGSAPDDADRIVKAAAFPERSGWLSPGNHNHLRLTRILRSLRLLGELRAAQALFEISTPRPDSGLSP